MQGESAQVLGRLEWVYDRGKRDIGQAIKNSGGG